MSATYQQNQTPGDPPEPIPPPPPLPLKALYWGIFAGIILGWVRFYSALANQALIAERLKPSYTWYLWISGLIWGLAGLPALWGRIRRASWSPLVIWMTAVFYPISYWFERLILWTNPNARTNDAFMLLLTILWLGLSFWALTLKGSKRFFGLHAKQTIEKEKQTPSWIFRKQK